MREPPELPDATLIDAVETEFGIPVSGLTFLPIGADSASAAFRVHAIDGANYFLKVRALPGFSPPSLLVPQYLNEQRVPNLLTPLPTTAQKPWVILNDFALSLFPFLEGRMGVDAGLSARHWMELGATMRKIHASQLPSDLTAILPRENFVPSRREVMPRLQTAIDSYGSSDPVQDELAEFWMSRKEEIRALLERADELANQLREDSASLVLCHADLHTWNILLDSRAHLWIVDWDETILALKERDLMFVMGGIARGLISPMETACFLKGYGEADIDPKALTYYRYAWAVQDMGAYGEQVFFSPTLGEASRRDALEGFRSLFEAGNIVDIAFGSDSIIR